MIEPSLENKLLTATAALHLDIHLSDLIKIIEQVMRVLNKERLYDLQYINAEMDAEIIRHHEDFRRISELLDAASKMAGDTGMWNVLKEIRDVVG